jgi:hypothetical protein
MKEIIFKIENKIWSTIENEDRIGLLTGLAGKGVFYNYLYQIYGNEDCLNKLMIIIEKINTLLESQKNISSLCSGLAGYGLFLLELDNDLIDIDEEYLLEIDNILLEELNSDCERDNYDFMHGAMGIALYFLERYKKAEKKDSEIVKKFLEDLVRKIIFNLESVLFSETGIDSEDRFCYYFGMAHGVAGYINFLVYFKQSFKESQIDIDQSLHICISYLKNFKKFDTNSKQFFPNLLLIKSNTILSSRLSWCQGDLGISNAFYNASLFLEDKLLLEEAEALIENCKEITFEDSLVKDFGICHGSAGILVQYCLAESNFSLDFAEQKRKWYDIVKMQTDEFEVFLSYSDSQYNVESNLLDGMTGLGLVLLTLDEKIDFKWMRFLNLH